MKPDVKTVAPVLALLLGACAPQTVESLAPSSQLQPGIDAAVAAGSDPIAIYATGTGLGRPQAGAAGFADPKTGRRMTPHTPVRVASNTKTFVAATALRLWEQGRLGLDAPIGPLLDPKLAQILRGDGYRTDQITVRHLLSHSAGLYDHGSDLRYVTRVLTENRHWTRQEQIGLMAEYADPQSPPGTEFRYSDTGYLLLGNIIERITGKSLAGAVRDELRLDRLGLQSTWWETFEQPPAKAEPRARQFFKGQDVTDLHPSFDLYGGGGQAMSAHDLAAFMAALFENRIFRRPETLREMLWKGPHKGAEAYRLGLQAEKWGEADVYSHSGFWGTYAYYNPERKIAAAGVTTNPQSGRTTRALVKQAAGFEEAKPQEGKTTSSR
jgi:D-alanyl-D-alanine carboxypeptidase